MFSSLVSFFSRLVSFIGGTTQDDAVASSPKASIDPSEEEAISEIEEALEAPKEQVAFLGEVEEQTHPEETTDSTTENEEAFSSSFTIGRLPSKSSPQTKRSPSATADQGAQVIALRSLFPDTANRSTPPPPPLRSTPSAQELFTEAEASLAPPAIPPPEIDLPSPYISPPPSAPTLPDRPKSFQTRVQVGRLMKPAEPEKPRAGWIGGIPPPPRAANNRKETMRLITPLDGDHYAEEIVQRSSQYANSSYGPMSADIPEQSGINYHDIDGERSASPRVVINADLDGAKQGYELIERQNFGIAQSIHERVAPKLKPLPVRFKKGDYLRFWGNYSAQEQYLHFGSLVRTSRITDIVPVWWDHLETLETEAKSEWEEADDDEEEGSADWRRLLMPVESSPINYLIQQDRLDQMSRLPMQVAAERSSMIRGPQARALVPLTHPPTHPPPPPPRGAQSINRQG